MEIIQTFRSVSFNRKYCGKNTDGWKLDRSGYISVALSGLLLQKYAGSLRLVTDHAGKQLLIDDMKLPYVSYTTDLDAIVNISSCLSKVSRLYTFRIQHKPLLVVDHAIYAGYDLVVPRQNNALMVASQQAITDPYYYYVINLLNSQFNAAPFGFQAVPYPEFIAYDLQICGGSDVTLIQRLGTYAFSFVRRFADVLSRYMMSIPVFEQNLVNTIIEQYLFYQFIQREQVTPLCLFDNTRKLSDSYAIFRFLHDERTASLAFEDRQLTSKSEQLECILKNRFPDYWYDIMHLIEKPGLVW